MDFILGKILHKLPEELSHEIVKFALKYGFAPKSSQFEDKVLNIRVFNKNFTNPIGLAAGFDKNAECIDTLCKYGFGFIECGTVTKLPQNGNLKPRLFRLTEDYAIINRMGFNNCGIEKFVRNINNSKIKPIVGINIGLNKNIVNNINNIEDYTALIKIVKNICDYVVINISSPNTPGLRDLHKYSSLSPLVIAAKSASIIDRYTKIPIVIKISPDISDIEKESIAHLMLEHNVDALIVSNTTIFRHGVICAKKIESGGLSGKPLFDISTRLLREMYILTKGKIPLIASGGVFDAESAYEKIKSGASLVQIYTSVIYRGFGVVNEIKKGLRDLLIKDGFSSVSDALGSFHS